MRKIINQRTTQIDAEVLRGFQELLKIYSPSCVVADSQERAGVMRSYLRPLTESTRFVGPALTVRLEPGNQVDCLDALSVAQAGDVIVVDAAGETETSIWGGLMSGLCQMKGVVGAVIDGAMRDIDETRDLGILCICQGNCSSFYSQPLLGANGADRNQRAHSMCGCDCPPGRSCPCR